MIANRLPALLIVSFCFFNLAVAHAEPTGIEKLGSAKFTVITPELIRMEYAADGKFIDAPSWFARNREAHDNHYETHHTGNVLTIDTGIIHLSYTDDGQSFSDKNLLAQIKTPGGARSWKPGTEQSGNLGGAIRGLDRIRSVVPLLPGVVSRDGWYLYDDSVSVIASKDWYTERPAMHETDWYFFGYGQDYKSALKSLTTISGEIPLPRKTTMGAWYSRNFRYTEDQFKQIVKEYHDNDFPLDNIVMDYGWHIAGWTGYTWNNELIPHPTELLKWYHDQGLSVIVNDHPDQSVRPTESMYSNFMTAMGQDPASQKVIPFDSADKHYLDTFWSLTHTPLMKQGVDFWWLDYGGKTSPSLPSINELAVLNQSYFALTSGDGKRGQSFSRWAGWGDQRNPIHFSGDADSSWNMLRFEVPFTSTSGNVGCFFWSHDMGGYRGGRVEEAYTRWVQFGAMSAALRSHSAGNADMDRRPWKYPFWATASMRSAFHLRSSLIPYVYTIAAQAVKDSVPFVRPMYIDNPQAEDAYHNGQEYMFGDNMLVAPITTPGAGDQRLSYQHVWFPSGTWYQYFTSEKYTGPCNVVAAAEINEFPLFVRSGVPIPEQPYNERPTSAKLSNLVLRCFPGVDGQKGNSHLYEDDGISEDYKHDGSAITELSYSRQGDDITIRIAPTQGHYQGQPASRAYTIILPCTQHGSLQSPDAAKIVYDTATGTNRIEIPEKPIGSETIVKVTAADLDPIQVRNRWMARRLDGLTPKPYLQWTDADRSALTPALRAAVQAIQGIALMPVNQNPYLYGSDVKLVYFNPAATKPMIGSLWYKSWKKTVVVSDAKPFDFDDAALAIAPEETISHPGVENRLFFKLNDGKDPVSFDTSELVYNLDNLATQAKPKTSKGRGENALDGVAEATPYNPDNEWIAPGESTAWIRLNWSSPVKATRVLLYDRPNLKDQVLAGKLTFSDGSTLNVGELPNDGKMPAEVTFAEKAFTWMQFDITKTSSTTKNVGLAEIAVFDR